MVCLRRMMVALAAMIALACSVVFVGVVWNFVGSPPEIRFTFHSENRMGWEGLGCTWEMTAANGEFEQLSIRPWPPLQGILQTK